MIVKRLLIVIIYILWVIMLATILLPIIYWILTGESFIISFPERVHNVLGTHFDEYDNKKYRYMIFNAYTDKEYYFIGKRNMLGLYTSLQQTYKHKTLAIKEAAWMNSNYRS